MTYHPIWTSDACLRCGVCVGTCPVGALTLRNTQISLEPHLCISCGRCISVCPTGCFSGGT
ncbi:MAG: 4Fe-4S binding protein [Candidatus Thermoplasmatota archaeon]|nr:4Fe-4S binding protein [Candidatus Thermoplasmatota archaeon]